MSDIDFTKVNDALEGMVIDLACEEAVIEETVAHFVIALKNMRDRSYLLGAAIRDEDDRRILQSFAQTFDAFETHVVDLLGIVSALRAQRNKGGADV